LVYSISLYITKLVQKVSSASTKSYYQK